MKKGELDVLVVGAGMTACAVRRRRPLNLFHPRLDDGPSRAGHACINPRPVAIPTIDDTWGRGVITNRSSLPALVVAIELEADEGEPASLVADRGLCTPSSQTCP